MLDFNTYCVLEHILSLISPYFLRVVYNRFDDKAYNDVFHFRVHGEIFNVKS